MAYRFLSLLQSFFIAVCGVSVLDFGLDLDGSSFGLNELLFANSGTPWWSFVSFCAYLFFIVAILQVIKAFAVTDD
jgi:hypothetical protein